MLRIAAAAVVLFLIVTPPARSQPANSAPTLELTLLPQRVGKGIPQAFTFRLVNRSNHNVWIPEPVIQCTDTSDGYLWLRVQATNGSSPGYGCAADRAYDHGAPTVLDRAKEWKVLAPGAMIERTVPGAELLYDAVQAGTYYEFWAEYYPPAITAADQQVLDERGIDFPVGKLATRHLTFSTSH
jgi:hypothetical protein